MAKDKPAKVQLKVYVEKDVHQKLKEHAAREGLPMSQIVEELIEGL